MARNLPPQPEVQRAAMREWVKRYGDIAEFCERHTIATRQAERFANGTQMIPPRMCREIEQAVRQRVTLGKADHLGAAFAALAKIHESEQARQRILRESKHA